MGSTKRITSSEMSDFFDQMAQFFPRMNTSAAVVELWHESLSRYGIGKLNSAFKRYVQTRDKAPALSDILELCKGLSVFDQPQAEPQVQSRGNMIREGIGAWRPKTKSEIVVEAFGGDFFKDAMAEIVVPVGGDIKGFRWTDLFKTKRWVEPYLRRLEELYLLARQTKGAPECIDARDAAVSKRLAEDPDFVTF